MRKVFISLIIILCVSPFVFAEEGMWLLSQVKNLELEKKGFEITPADIYTPGKPGIAQAIVNLGGGTGGLVSPNGLMLTNHHVAFGAVQRASTQGTDYISNGFLAQTLAEEIEAPGYSARIIEEIKDITPEFARYEKIKDVVERDKAIDLKIKAITENLEKGKKDISAEVGKMYNGKQFILFIYKRYDDVRVVYVPPESIGNYGGEIDNWMWPRHTGDFSFMRIYMAPNGSGRAFNKENVPYKSKYWLKIAQDGLKNGDQTFVMGYPGRTTRYRTSDDVDDSLNHVYPLRIKYFKEIIDMLDIFAKDSQVAGAKVAGMSKGLNNSMKNYQGNVDGMKRTNFVRQKIDFENQFMAFLKTDEKLYKKYGRVLEKIKDHYDSLAKYQALDDVLRMVISRVSLNGLALSTAQKAYYTAMERSKPVHLQDPNFSEKDITRWVERLQFSYMSLYEPADKALLKKWLKWADQLPVELRLKGLDEILKTSGKTIDQWVDEAYEKSKMTDVTFAKSLFNKKVKELEALNDPFVDLAKKLYPDEEAFRERDRKNAAVLEELRKEYINALYAWKGSNLYPDANGTIRFSYGGVEGYSPRDAVYYEPFTTIKGMLEKDTGQKPFDMPEVLKDLYAKKDFGRWIHPGMDDISIAFTHTVDSTGGNSGSPVMNTKGEMVGILFDGNYEAMTCDWQYDSNIQRTISADIRFVMFITEKFAKAHAILKEMGLE
ncbi:MAG TPA: S46 family peptidase [Candidatus Deferrimicrobium sp.]|nr:S46 family peptidase [Candidatus Deferrimicrobium sp.]